MSLFEEFIKYHEPRIRNYNDDYFFCDGILCFNCKLSELCTDTDGGILKPEEFKEIKQKYPEYFI